MAFCDQCGERLPAGANFCPECGARQKVTPPVHHPVEILPEVYPGPLKTNRGLLKTILLSFLTFGIYVQFVYASIAKDLNTIASPYDGKKTMNYWLVLFIVTPITLGLGGLFWLHNLSDRIGNELVRRRIPYKFGAETFWIWGMLMSLLFGIGYFIYMYKLFKAMNYLAQDYNASNRVRV